MDEITSKWKKLFKSKPKAFKGQGQKLGQVPAACCHAWSQSLLFPAHTLLLLADGFDRKLCSRPAPSELSTSTLTTTTWSWKAQPCCEQPPVWLSVCPRDRKTRYPTRFSCDNRRLHCSRSAIGTASQTHRPTVLACLLQLDFIPTVDEVKPTEAQQEAFALLSSAQQRTAAAEILSKVLRNIVEHPTESKYRCSLLVQRNLPSAAVTAQPCQHYTVLQCSTLC